MAKKMNLELTEGQMWLIARGLMWMTTPAGATAIMTQYPDCDYEALLEDLNGLLERMEQARGITIYNPKEKCIGMDKVHVDGNCPAHKHGFTRPK